MGSLTILLFNQPQTTNIGWSYTCKKRSWMPLSNKLVPFSGFLHHHPAFERMIAYFRGRVMGVLKEMPSLSEAAAGCLYAEVTLPWSVFYANHPIGQGHLHQAGPALQTRLPLPRGGRVFEAKSAGRRRLQTPSGTRSAWCLAMAVCCLKSMSSIGPPQRSPWPLPCRPREKGQCIGHVGTNYQTSSVDMRITENSRYIFTTKTEKNIQIFCFR